MTCLHGETTLCLHGRCDECLTSNGGEDAGCLRDALRFVGKPAPHAIALSVEAREQLAWMEKLLVDMAGALDNIDHIRRMLYVASPGCRGEYHPAQTDCDWCVALANLADLERVCLRAGGKTT